MDGEADGSKAGGGAALEAGGSKKGTGGGGGASVTVTIDDGAAAVTVTVDGWAVTVTVLVTVDATEDLSLLPLHFPSKISISRTPRTLPKMIHVRLFGGGVAPGCSTAGSAGAIAS